MSIYKELEQSINKVMEKSDESEEFTRRFRKLIENSLATPIRDEDVLKIIKLVESNS